MIRVTADRRMYVGGHRIHHGLVGVCVGALLALHDKRDWRQWLPDLWRRA